MKKIERIVYREELPASFFSIPKTIYAELPFNPAENSAAVQQLFLQQRLQNEIIIYTDHSSIRLTGIFDKQTNEVSFGFWETVDDLSLNAGAFNMFFEDAMKHSATKITGPINFNTFNAYRLRNGAYPSWKKFDKEPVNPAYYSGFLEQLKFYEIHKYESQMIKSADIEKVYDDKLMLLEEVKNLPYQIIPLNEQTWCEYEDDIYALVVEAFSQNPAFKTIEKNAFLKIYNSDYAKALCPHTSVLFFDPVVNKIIAMSFCHPNYNSLQLPSHIKPEYSRDYQRLQHKTLLAKTIAVCPGYRQQGLMNYLGAYAMLSFKQYYSEVIFCLMRLGNHSLQFTKGLPYESAEYALYQKSF